MQVSEEGAVCGLNVADYETLDYVGEVCNNPLRVCMTVCFCMKERMCMFLFVSVYVSGEMRQ